MCQKHPTLIEHYSIDSNKGYGAKKHLDGIKTHGITEWHRKSFAPCRNNGATKNELNCCVNTVIIEEDDEDDES